MSKIGIMITCPACGHEKNTIKFKKPSAIGRAVCSLTCVECFSEYRIFVKPKKENRQQMDVEIHSLHITALGRDTIRERKTKMEGNANEQNSDNDSGR